MPLFNGVTLKNAAAANVVLSAVSKTDGAFIARNSTAIADQAMRSSMRLTSNTVSDRSVTKITIPVIREINGVATVVESMIVDVSVRVPKLATAAERAEALATARSAYSDTNLASFFDASQGLW